jgi:hypothetical protein
MVPSPSTDALLAAVNEVSSEMVETSFDLSADPERRPPANRDFQVLGAVVDMVWSIAVGGAPMGEGGDK